MLVLFLVLTGLSAVALLVGTVWTAMVFGQTRWRRGPEAEAEFMAEQRIAFFKNQDGRLLHIPTAPPNYWGIQWGNRYRWGELVYYGVDHEWREDIAAFVTETIAQICATNCLEDRLPLILTVAKDYGQESV